MKILKPIVLAIASFAFSLAAAFLLGLIARGYHDVFLMGWNL